MTPATARAVTLLLTLLLSAPTLSQLSSGALPLEPALLRCGGALVLCWTGVSVLARLLTAYAPQAGTANATSPSTGPSEASATSSPTPAADTGADRRR